MKTCSEPLLWNCQRCGNPFQLEEWEAAGRECPVCHQSTGRWKCSLCQELFGEPSLSDVHPCRQDRPPKTHTSGKRVISFPKQKATFVCLGILTALGIVIWQMQKDDPNRTTRSTVIESRPTVQTSSQTASVVPATSYGPIRFVQSYAEALRSQDPDSLVAFFSKTRPIMYYNNSAATNWITLRQHLYEDRIKNTITPYQVTPRGGQYITLKDTGEKVYVADIDFSFQRDNGTSRTKTIRILFDNPDTNPRIFLEFEPGKE